MLVNGDVMHSWHTAYVNVASINVLPATEHLCFLLWVETTLPSVISADLCLDLAYYVQEY
jgi:hypothetical protein